MNLVEQKFGKMIPYNGKPLGNGPCTYYTVDGFEGKLGLSAQSAINSAASVIVYGLRHRDI